MGPHKHNKGTPNQTILEGVIAFPAFAHDEFYPNNRDDRDDRNVDCAQTAIEFWVPSLFSCMEPPWVNPPEAGRPVVPFSATAYGRHRAVLSRTV